MTINVVTPPTPPNSNLDRAMFVWIPQVGGASDPMSSDSNMQAVLNLCSSRGVNLIYLDVWQYLGGGNFTVAHAATIQKFIHYAHGSGIRVFALAGNYDWGHAQSWVEANILRRILEYNALAAGATTNTGGAFDGLLFDVEYWTQSGYTTVEPMGLCDLMVAAKRILSLPVGCFATQWLADPSSAALSFAYAGGPSQIEGLNLMACADFIVVGCYSNSSATQITEFNNWFTAAAATGVGANFGLLCGSETGTGLGSASYWTGAPGALSTMETAHTAISNAFTASPNTNCPFRGQAIDPYASYSQMA